MFDKATQVEKAFDKSMEESKAGCIMAGAGKFIVYGFSGMIQNVAMNNKFEVLGKDSSFYWKVLLLCVSARLFVKTVKNCLGHLLSALNHSIQHILPNALYIFYHRVLPIYFFDLGFAFDAVIYFVLVVAEVWDGKLVDFVQELRAMLNNFNIFFCPINVETWELAINVLLCR